MDAVGLTSSIAQTVFAALQSSQLKDILSICGYQSELERLTTTMSTINSVLLDADSNQQQGIELTHQLLNYVDQLKDVVYDADDLLDEVITSSRLQQLEDPSKRQVCRLFSSIKKLQIACKVSREVKKIRKKLDEIASDARFKVDCQPQRMIREETSPYLEPSVFGREDDKRQIIDRLLDPNVEAGVSILSIVGVGGVGKTTLAQLVFNDKRVETEFPVRFWVCVSDQNQKQLDVKGILANILKSATNENISDELGIQQIVRKLKEKLDRSKYLLVLDDVWTEDHCEWLRLERYLLELGGGGSRIVVTSRSDLTAEAVRSFLYRLNGLSDDHSWRLFEEMVGKEQANCHDFVEIGKEIVKKCANVPLAIKVIGSALYDQDKIMWQTFQQSTLSKIKIDENGIMPILKFSYYHLSPQLKSCFRYCAVFPKDFVIQKNILIGLWMAQGYLGPLDQGQTLEAVGEKYFGILLHRCFFQDIKKDEYKEILSCKIHDLMHDLAQEVAGNEFVVADSLPKSLEQQRAIRHLYNEGDLDNFAKSFIKKSRLRTHLQKGDFEGDQISWSMLLERWMNLRALRMGFVPNRIGLFDAVGKLLHLRYLDLSKSMCDRLPESITRLVNLQTLILNWMACLKELPQDFSRLVNLRVLEMDYCNSLKCMPAGMGRLTCLNRLTKFVVANRDSSMLQCGVSGLEDLGALEKLRGRLEITIGGNYVHKKEKNESGGGYLRNKEHLNEIKIEWDLRNRENEDLLEDLQPHHNLKGLDLLCYGGVKIPWLGKLRFLKSLVLRGLDELEYMEDNANRCDSSNDYGAGSTTAAEMIKNESSSSSFFPSLEKLKLHNLPKLKGWWRDSPMSTNLGKEDDEMMSTDSSMHTPNLHQLPSFPRLSELWIDDCPCLTCIPLCPTVETLELRYFNEGLGIMKKNEEEKEWQREVCDSSDWGSQMSFEPKLTTLTTTNVRHLKSLPVVAFQRLNRMEVSSDGGVVSLSEVREVLRSCSSSLRTLQIKACNKLRSVWGGGLEYLTALDSLYLERLPELTFEESEEEDGSRKGESMQWRCLGNCLHSLALISLDKVVDLPEGMRYLTALQSLFIFGLPLKAIPEWIGCLSSLHSLTILSCELLESMPQALQKLTSLRGLELYQCNPILHKRCESPHGEDWPNIQHISYFLNYP